MWVRRNGNAPPTALTTSLTSIQPTFQLLQWQTVLRPIHGPPVLDFTRQLLETGVENDLVLSLVVFSLQYLLVNHEYWKYKVKHVRWKITLKVLQVIKTCIISTLVPGKLGEVIRETLCHPHFRTDGD
ncbi:hypothetical protein KPL70_023046 [Citrus sinensis]|nr:hypothetical protein KPL70_023046 [Citrus sinensis]